jgi:putative membrane protein
MKRSLALFALVAALAWSSPSWAKSPAELNDLEIAHVAYTADTIDIRYAHLALGISKNPQVRTFAETMIRDHTAVNDRALALLKKLNVQPQDNFLSQQLVKQSDALVAELRQLNGREFDRRYAGNELSYHGAVNNLVEKTFIPNLKHPDVKALFEDALVVFKAHEEHAQQMVNSLQK